MRNAEASRERIMSAALTEFACYGVAGARVDRIAQSAGCNKNLIYIYFASKEGLFSAVLKKNLTQVYEDLPFTPDDLPAYAMRVFDFAMANPELMRLMTWFNLENKVDGPVERGAAHRAKLAALKTSQSDGQIEGEFSPSFLLTVVMTLATAWTPANLYGESLEAAAIGRVRQAIGNAVALLCHPTNRVASPGSGAAP